MGTARGGGGRALADKIRSRKTESTCHVRARKDRCASDRGCPSRRVQGHRAGFSGPGGPAQPPSPATHQDQESAQLPPPPSPRRHCADRCCRLPRGFGALRPTRPAGTQPTRSPPLRPSSQSRVHNREGRPLQARPVARQPVHCAFLGCFVPIASMACNSPTPPTPPPTPPPLHRRRGRSGDPSRRAPSFKYTMDYAKLPPSPSTPCAPRSCKEHGERCRVGERSRYDRGCRIRTAKAPHHLRELLRARPRRFPTRSFAQAVSFSALACQGATCPSRARSNGPSARSRISAAPTHESPSWPTFCVVRGPCFGASRRTEAVTMAT